MAFGATTDDLLRTVDLFLDGRRIWSFRVADAVTLDESEEGIRLMPWPRVMPPYLEGRSTFTLRATDGEGPELETVARFGDSDEPIAFADSHGLGLIINKWGNIGHALSDYPAGIEQRILDRLDFIRGVLADHSNVDVYVTGGTLLGPYRDGRVMPNDDDADLAYLSAHSHPADVARECLQIGRALVQEGISVVRCSAGHLQLHFEHEGRPDGYIDIFTGWIDDFGWWYQLFPIRAQVRREQLVPPRPLLIEGREEPMCREPEVMLEAIYGPNWATPDPGFHFEVPQDTQDRFYGWMSDQHHNRTPWEDRYRYDVLGNRVELGTDPTDYVRAVAETLDPGSFVVELGAGRGHDALWLARQGHTVEAMDYVRWPMARAREYAVANELPAGFRTLNLYDPRRILAFGAEMAGRGRPATVYARDLLATMWDVGRPNLWRLLSMLLRSGGQAHLDFPLSHSLAPDPPLGGPMHRSLDLEVLAEEMSTRGLVVTATSEVTEPITWPNTTGTFDMTKTRMVVSWQRATR